MLVCGALLAAARPGVAAAPPYELQFLATLRPGEPSVEARIRVVQPDAQLKSLRLNMPEQVYDGIRGDGRVTRSGNEVQWRIPQRGGELRYRARVTHERNDKGYDAYIDRQWALFRAEDVFPAAEATLRAGARGQAELLLDLPPGWTGLTPYLPDAANRLRITPRGRRYERPLGWILAGRIGSRKDVIGTTTVRVAAPVATPAPRVPALALLRWTLPVLQAELPVATPYLLIVMAGDPMWRGGLSAPNSLYLHVDRPLISENGTSTLVHELLHVLAPVPAAAEHDWIDEGLAEYLGLVLMVRSGTISRERFDHALDVFRQRGSGIATILTRNAGGAVKARAVAIFGDVDSELRSRTGGQRDIFDLVRLLMREEAPVDIRRLRALAAGLADGNPITALSPARVPGTR